MLLNGSNEPGEASARALELRQAFDRSFAKCPEPAAANRQAFLAIRIGAQPCALRLSEVAGLTLCGRVVAIPGGTPALLGLAGIKGAVVPVFDLGELLGLSKAEGSLRWVALCGTERVGLAFSDFEHYFTAAPSDICSMSSGESRDHSHEIVSHGGVARRVAGIPSILQQIYGADVSAH